MMTARAVRVLVADDNEDHRFLTVRALRESEGGADLTVDTVSDGEAALDYMYQRGDYADRSRPHLVLLDLKMPRRNGLEVLAAVKADPKLRSIPVVVLTSSDRPEDVHATYELGGNSFVSKPAGMASLREGLQGVTSYWTQTASLPEPGP